MALGLRLVSSDAAISAYPNWGAYGVSKAALDHLARSFAAELGDSGVRFFSVDPGEMNTKMHSDALPDADVATLGNIFMIPKGADTLCVSLEDADDIKEWLR